MNIKNLKALLFTCCCVFTLTNCSVNKATIDDELAKYFEAKSVEGCFTLLNNADGQITVYNLNYDTTRYTPYGTFHVITSLVGLQNGAITNPEMQVPWDGIIRSEKNWNKNLALNEALQTNAEPYFKTIANKIGYDNLKKWVDSISYGNRLMAAPLDSVWSNQQLKISPDEQLGLMKKIYFDQLPFRKTVQQSVREAMLKEDNTLYKLSYQTGSGSDFNGKSIGWITGWIEENRHVYFFTCFIKSNHTPDQIQRISLDISKDILKHYDFFQGKK